MRFCFEFVILWTYAHCLFFQEIMAERFGGSKRNMYFCIEIAVSEMAVSEIKTQSYNSL